MTWQPIETAPKDTMILAWGDSWHWSRVEKAFLHSDYNGHENVICRGGEAGPPWKIGSPDAPTHWHPLPPPPSEHNNPKNKD